MSVKWVLYALLQYEIVVITSPTIAGLTYMDNYDFEEKYTDFNKCNPFYWHPLHLPEMCADMYEKLIRLRLRTKIPLRIMSDREDEYTDAVPMYELGSHEYEEKKKEPYEKMLDMLKKDINKDPSQPEFGFVPNVGPAMIYKQEISKKSENMIKKLATKYAKYVQKSYAKYYGYNKKADPQLYYYDSANNKTDKEKSKSKKKNKITRTKTKYGGVVTIVETMNPRQRRSAIYLPSL